MFRRIILFVLSMLIINPVFAGFYKCINSNGDIKYQASPCSISSTTKKVNVRPESKSSIEVRELININKQKEQESKGNINANNRNIQNSLDNSAKIKKQDCINAKQSLKAMKKRIVEQCKTRRNNYCRKSPLEIARLNDLNDTRKLFKNDTVKGRHQYNRYMKSSRGFTEYDRLKSKEKYIKGCTK